MNARPYALAPPATLAVATYALSPHSASGYLAYLRSTDHSWKQILIQTVLHIGLRFGQAEDVSPELCHPIKDERRSVALSFSNPLINHGIASLRLI